MRRDCIFLRCNDAKPLIERTDAQASKQFLEAFESLKGGGHITEIEGQKATDAMSRLGQTGQKESEYRIAAQELKDVLLKGVERARMRAGQGGLPPSSPTIDDLLKKY